MDQESVERAAKYLARRMRPFRSSILHAGKFVGRWVAIIAVISATVSFVLDGTDFISRKVPATTAFVAKLILFRETFRPLLIDRLKTDPAFERLCVEYSRVLDLDNNGDATDLLVAFFPQNEQLTCPELNETPEATYAVFKEVGWRGFWPSFEVVRTISRSDIGNFFLGSGYPMTFEQLGPFLLGSIYGTDFPAYAVYGYTNGTLQSLGLYPPVGSLIENPQAEPKAQIGNRLVLFAEEGMKSFELKPDGRFEARTLSAHDIVDMNNSALVIEDSEKMPVELVEKLEAAKSKDVDTTDVELMRYKLLDDPDKGCDYLVFMNGTQIALKHQDEPGNVCGADVQISPETSIISNVACNYQGFLESRFFPWGHVYDPAASEHTISCPDDGESENSSYAYVLTVGG